MPSYSEKLIIFTLHVDPQKGANHAFVSWQAKFNSKFVSFPGIISLEFLSPNAYHKEWLVVQRFSTTKCAEEWHTSPDYLELIAELKGYVVQKGIWETTADDPDVQIGSTEIFVTKVTPENERAFREWNAKIHQAEASFPGFRGVYLQAPIDGEGRWITLLQFDCVENLDRWLDSTERKALLSEAAPLITSLETNRVISPYAGWFASIAKVGELPPVWKQTMLVLLVLFPIVMLELKYLSPLLNGLNFSLATFIGNALSVTLISFPMMPVAIWFLGWWLLPRGKSSRKWTIIGTLLILILYLIEIVFFWFFGLG